MCCLGQGQGENSMSAKGMGRGQDSPQTGERVRELGRLCRDCLHSGRQWCGDSKQFGMDVFWPSTAGPDGEQVGLFPAVVLLLRCSWWRVKRRLLVCHLLRHPPLPRAGGPRNLTKHRAMEPRVKFHKCSPGIGPWRMAFSFCEIPSLLLGLSTCSVL